MTEERTLTVLVVRHGQTAWNAEGRWQGQTDVPLSPVGREQARLLGVRLAHLWESGALPGPPARILCSDLARARETAEILQRESGSAHVPLGVAPELRERGFGAWEGLTFAEVTERWGKLDRPGDGEPHPQVWARMLGALESLWNSADDDKVALAVGHGGSLRCWLAHCAGLGDADLRRFALGNTSLSVLTWTGDTLSSAKGRLLRVNDCAHLE